MPKLARWKQSPERVKTFIRRGLKTSGSMAEIARRAHATEARVYYINKNHQIRPLEYLRSIGTAAGAKKRLRKRAKVCTFSEEQKGRLLKQYEGALYNIAKRWWNQSGVLRKKFGSAKDILGEINVYAFEQLDYYDPSIKGRGGRTTKPQNWMLRGANFFCMHSSVEKKEKPTGETDRKRLRDWAESKQRVSIIPRTARVLLRKIGFDLPTVASLGYESIKNQLLKTACTGLSDREKTVIEKSLDGKRVDAIVKELGGSRLTLIAARGTAIEKIRKNLAGLKQG